MLSPPRGSGGSAPPSHRVVVQDRVEDGVADLVTQLVGVAFRDRFRREQVVGRVDDAGHRAEGYHRRSARPAVGPGGTGAERGAGRPPPRQPGAATLGGCICPPSRRSIATGGWCCSARPSVRSGSGSTRSCWGSISWGWGSMREGG